MGGLKRGIEAGFEAVKNVVGGIAGWIKNNKGPISYDRVLLIPAGKAIMQGLGVGLESQLPMLKRTLDVVTATMTDAITEAFATSKMYAAGADAAKGLADGLDANKALVSAAFAGLDPSADPTVNMVAGSGGSDPRSPGKHITIQNLTIPVTTPTKDPELVAAKVIDEFAAEISNF